MTSAAAAAAAAVGPHCGVPADLANGLSATDDPAARSDPKSRRRLGPSRRRSPRSVPTTAPRFSPRRCGGAAPQDALLRSFLGDWRGALGGRRGSAVRRRACVEELANADLTPRRAHAQRPLNLPGGGADSDSDCATSEDEDCGGEDGPCLPSEDRQRGRRETDHPDGWYRSQKSVDTVPYATLTALRAGFDLPPVHVQIILRGRRRVARSGVRYFLDGRSRHPRPLPSASRPPLRRELRLEEEEED